MPRIKVVDTNVILRHLLGDVEELANEADRLFEGAFEGRYVLFIPQSVVAESVYVLTKTYNVPRNKVSEVLKELIRYKGCSVQDMDVVEKALEMFGFSNNLSFVDCMICAFKQLRGMELASFDRKLLKECQ